MVATPFALLAFLALALALALLALALAMAVALWSSILVDLGLATGTRETDLVSLVAWFLVMLGAREFFFSS